MMEVFLTLYLLIMSMMGQIINSLTTTTKMITKMSTSLNMSMNMRMTITIAKTKAKAKTKTTTTTMAMTITTTMTITNNSKIRMFNCKHRHYRATTKTNRANVATSLSIKGLHLESMETAVIRGGIRLDSIHGKDLCMILIDSNLYKIC